MHPHTLRAERDHGRAARLHGWHQDWQPGPQHAPKWTLDSPRMLGWISLHLRVQHIWSSCSVLTAGGGRFNDGEERVTLGSTETKEVFSHAAAHCSSFLDAASERLNKEMEEVVRLSVWGTEHVSVINEHSCIPAWGACNCTMLIVDLFDIWTLSFKTNTTEKLLLCLCSVHADAFGHDTDCSSVPCGNITREECS